MRLVAKAAILMLLLSPALRGVAQTASTPQQFLELWGKAWDSHEVEAVLRLYSDDCVTVDRFGVVTRGKDSTRRAVAWLQNGPFHTTHFGAPKLLVQRKLAPGLVMLQASWRNPSGRQPPASSEDDLILTFVLRDDDREGWVAEQININNVDPLAPGTMPEPQETKPTEKQECH